MFLALLGAIILAGCGNGDTTSQSSFNNGSGNQPFKPTTHLSHRSVVSNSFAGQLQVMDATQDRLTTTSFATGSQPTHLQSSPDGTLTFVNNSGSNSISSLNNNLEAVKATINLSGSTESFVTSVSNKFGFAAVSNYSNGTFRIPGAIVRFNPTDGSLNTQIPFPFVQTIAMDVAEKHLLAFTQGAPTVSGADVDDNAHWVDLTATDPSTQVPPYYTLALSDASGTSVQLSRPIAAFFSSDNTKAFILNCGLECGASQAASVTEIDTTTITVPASTSTNAVITATVLNNWQVKGAQSGLIDLVAGKLYVAGSTGATLIDAGGKVVQDGFFTAIDLSTGTVGTPIQIGNGSNRLIRNIKGVFWVGARNCGVQSCITMVNPSAGSAPLLPTAHGDATGISLSINSSKIYTIEGGELFIYDKNANPVISQYNTDVKGQAFDVLYID
jgi:hypothetical protein